MNRKYLLAISAAILLLSAGSLVYGQKTTEQFIPIGKSPGVSDKSSVIGGIDQYDAEGKTLSVNAPSGKQTFKLTEQTKIYLDRTKIKQVNVKGNFSDLRKGRKVEVKYKDPDNKTTAEWIKIEITEPGS